MTHVERGAATPPVRGATTRERAFGLAVAIAVVSFIAVVLITVSYYRDQTSRTASLFADVPRYPNAVAVNSQRTDQLVEASYVTGADRQSISIHYDRALRAAGWTLTGHLNNGELAKDCYSNGGFTAAVTTRSSVPIGSWVFAFAIARSSDLCVY